MPLINSSGDKARATNISKEISAGKDPKQAAAIAYATQRRAKAKGLAEGGEPEAASAPKDKPAAKNPSLNFDNVQVAPPPTVQVPNVLQQPQRFAAGGVTVGTPEFDKPTKTGDNAWTLPPLDVSPHAEVAIGKPHIEHAKQPEAIAQDGFAHGGTVPPVPHHQSAALRWPLAHLSERGRRQESYQLGLHMKHHFAEGGVAGEPGSETKVDPLTNPRAVSAKEYDDNHPKLEGALEKPRAEEPKPKSRRDEAMEFAAQRSPAASPTQTAAESHSQQADAALKLKPHVVQVFADQDTPEKPTPAVAPAVSQSAVKPSTEDQVETERQATRQAALHPSVFTSIRRALANGLTAFGGGTPTDFHARDQAEAKAADEQALTRLNMLHGNQQNAHLLASQDPNSARSAGLQHQIAGLLGIKSAALQGIAQEDMERALQAYHITAQTDAAKAALQLKATMEAAASKQKDRSLDIAQQRANAANRDVNEKAADRETKEIQPMAAQLSRVTQPTRVLLDAADRASATLDEMQASGTVTPGQVQIFLNELDKLSSGGAATQYGVEGLDTHTIMSRLAALKQAVTGAASDTGKLPLLVQQYGGLLKQLQAANRAAYQNRVKDVANNYSYLKSNPRYRATVEAAMAGRVAEQPEPSPADELPTNDQEAAEAGIPFPE